MSTRTSTTRIYARKGRGARRYWADFRQYADVGGKREPLVAAGERVATTNRDVAQHVATARLRELEEARKGRGLGVKPSVTLEWMVLEHLTAKSAAGRVTDRWVESNEKFLEAAMREFGRDRELGTITVVDVRQWVEKLQRERTSRKKARSAGTARHYLNGLSNLYRRAMSEGHATFNPAAAMMDKPIARHVEARWLEVSDAAVLLERARLYVPSKHGGNERIPFAYALIAMHLLTGARTREVLGLERTDINFERQTVTFRPNRWRRLKTAQSTRVVRMFPQLEEILRTYLDGPYAPTGALLFPSKDREGREAMIDDFRKLLDNVADGLWAEGEVRSKMFRHTYCSARLQTLDHGAPVSPFTVARDLGHGGDAMVKAVYSHLGEVRHRSEVVEYRVEQHTKAQLRLRELEEQRRGLHLVA
jgi:integrase